MGILPQRMPGTHSNVAGQSTGNTGGEGCLFPEAAGPAVSWAAGAPGRPRCCLFSAPLVPKVGGGDWRGHKEAPRAPGAHGEAGQEGTSASPGCRLLGAERPGSGSRSTAMQGRPPGLTPSGLGSKASWWGSSGFRKRWVLRPLPWLSPNQTVGICYGGQKARKGGSAPREGGGSTPQRLLPPGLRQGTKST